MNRYCILVIACFITISPTCRGMHFLRQSKKKEEPLILISDGEHYKLPEQNENIVQSNKRFFCPAESKDMQEYNQYCLTEVEKNAYCEKPVQPLLIKSEKFPISCGTEGKSYYYDFVYRICKPNTVNAEDQSGIGWTQPKFKTNDLLVYRICYNYEDKIAAFTYHKIVKSTLLQTEKLKNQLTISIKFSKIEYGYDDFHFKNMKSDYSPFYIHFRDEKPRLSYSAEPLMLVSSDDMPSDLMKKPLFHYINVIPSWKNIVKMWDLINEYIRSIALTQNMTIYQINGVLGQLMLQNKNIYLNRDDNIRAPKYIWKIVYTEKHESFTLVINNVPDERYDFEIERLCNKNEYNIDPWNLQLISKQLVYFCKTDEVRTLFHLPEHLSLLENPENFTPLILSKYPGRYDFPKSFRGIPPQSDSKQPEVNFCYEGDYANKPADQDNCLIPVHNSENQYCIRPLEPLVDDLEFPRNEFECKGVTLSVGYRICSINSDEEAKSFDLKIYYVCQDNDDKNTVFTYYRIISPILLRNKYLQNERKRNYQMESYHESGELGVNFYMTNQDYIAENFNHPLYGWIRQLPMTSPDDMAFALWRKSTYHRINLKFAWENVIKIWSKINEKIRTQAIKANEEIIQINGWEDKLIIDGKIVETETGSTLSAYFWKLVYTSDKERGIAIILHNMPTKDHLSSVKKLCPEGLCNMRNLNLENIPEIDEFAYCCEPSVITKKYGFPETDYIMTIEDF